VTTFEREPATSSTAPARASSGARYTRRQEALAIGWLRSLARSSRATVTTAEPAPAAATRAGDADPEEPA